MASISDAVSKNAARIAAGGATGTGVGPENSAQPPPSAPMDMPAGAGLPQRGMFPANFVLASDRSDSSRTFRGQGQRSATFPYQQSPTVTKQSITNITQAASAATVALLLQTNGINNPNQKVLNLIAGSGIQLGSDPTGGVTITGAAGGAYPTFIWPEIQESVAGAGISIGANAILLVAFQLPDVVIVNKIGTVMSAFGPSDTNSWGIYDLTGALKCDVGPQVINVATNTIFDITVQQGPTTLSAGTYYFAMTSLAGRSNFLSVATSITMYPRTTASVSSSGQLPSTVVPAAFAPSVTPTRVPIFFLH